MDNKNNGTLYDILCDIFSNTSKETKMEEEKNMPPGWDIVQAFCNRENSAKTCCFTGHRNIQPDDEQKILTQVSYILEPLLEKGITNFAVGGAVGFDMLMAEYLMDLRDRQEKEIKIISVIPYPGYMKNWSDEQKCRQEIILKKSDKVVYVQQKYTKGVYLARDRKLVDESGYCISYCNRRSGGTAYTVRYALAQGLEVFNASSWDIRQLKKT